MTRDEFLKRYHLYQTSSKEEAIAEAGRVNAEGVDNSTAIPVGFGGLGWCLMLDTAVDGLSDMGVTLPEVIRESPQ